MSSTLSSSARYASSLVLIQVASRAVTFIGNQLLLRYMSPELLGASTQLELYSISVLYFARESIRVALQRHIGNAQAVVNLSYVSIFLGIPLAYVLGSLYTSSSLPDIPYIVAGIKLYGFAAILELLTEPCFALVQQKLAYKIRTAAETQATILRMLVTTSCVVWSSRRSQDLGVLPFGFGQFAYALCLFVTYYSKTTVIAKSEASALTPRKPPITEGDTYLFSYLSKTLCVLAANIYVQSTVKYFLTHGASLLVTALTTISEQGGYALASNYGGLIARMLFQPIEESCRNLIGRLCAAQPDTKKPARKSLEQASNALVLIIRFYNIIALVAWSIGPSVAPLLLQLIAGRRWAHTGAGDVLATYCYYIPLLAINGITEAFVAAVASNADLKRQSMLMTLWFFVFAGSAYVLLQTFALGAQGLVWADCLNMLLRITWNVSFIKRYFAQHGMTFRLSPTLPSRGSIGLTVATAATVISLHSRQVINAASPTTNIVQSFGLAVLYGIVLLILERQFFLDCYKMVRPQS